MLVVALLSVIAAISFPALRRNLTRADVTSAARELQQHLQRARLQAMETGEGFLFLAEEDAGSFFLGPLSVYGRLGTELNMTLAMTETMTETSPEEQSNWVHSLPLPMRFVSVNRQATKINDPDSQAGMNESYRRSLDQGQNRGFRSSEDAVDDEISDSLSPLARAIVFYPNGRIQSATILIASNDGYQIPVEIEGLAGRVKVGQIRRDITTSFAERSGSGEDE